MRRRDVLRLAAVLPLVPAGQARAAPLRRVRPGDPGWPTPVQWEALNREVGGHLINVRSPFAACAAGGDTGACDALFREFANPYYIRDQAGLTQTLGWADAWTSRPSTYAVAARSSAAVAAAVNFARTHKLRLVVRGGGHSYQGTSDAPDSLLIWTRYMDQITLHDAFVPSGCSLPPMPAASIGAGAIWMHTYDAVTTKGGRYVQGGGCATVGVAGLIQSGGFGSFSKNFGTAAASLLEAEIVTADGEVRLANACTNPDLFWGLKGGGGGCLGAVTRLTLRIHDLPDVFGIAYGSIQASSDSAFRRLVSRFVAFYAEALFNRHWGESVVFGPDNRLDIQMVFQGLGHVPASAAWRPFIDEVIAAPRDFPVVKTPRMIDVPARHFWDPDYMERAAPGLFVRDDRPGAPAGNVLYTGDQHQAGQFLSAYGSAWLPARLLNEEHQVQFTDALFAASRHWRMALHFNKGLAGAPAEAIAAARDTATNPAVLDAFALAICGAASSPAYPGIPGHEPDLPAARKRAAAVGKAMGELLKLVPEAGSYVSESDYFLKDWQRAFWGSNYARLAAVKQRYDPDGLFIVHHGIGSEDWSDDGFTRRT